MTTAGKLTTIAALLFSLLAVTDAFSTVSSRSSIGSTTTSFHNGCTLPFRRAVILRATDDDDDDDEEEIDDASLGDWRKFRASLIDGGLPGSTAVEKEKEKPRKSVAEKNEELLAQQNAKLAEEYRAGVWAHTVGQPEVGGLLCRMPLEAELYYSGTGYWKEELDLMLSMDKMDGKGPSSSEGARLDEEVNTDLITVTKVDQ
jgi:hypothetical protein